MTTAQGAAGSVSRTNRSNRRTQDQINVSRFKNSFSLIVAITVVLLMLVLMTAVSAELQTRNNDLRQENSNLQAEIDSLNTQIGDATNIERIEKIATQELGMVQPDADNYITVSEEATVDQDLAAVIKDEAYN